MILVDADLLLYAYIANYPQHARARAWLNRVLNDPRRVGLPWSSLLAFLRISTNPRAFTKPASIEAAWQPHSLQHRQGFHPLRGAELREPARELKS